MDYQRDVLQPEDVRLCESVTRGLQSKGYNQGRFVIDPERSELSEHAVHHFQQMYVDTMSIRCWAILVVVDRFETSIYFSINAMTSGSRLNSFIGLS